MRVHFTLVNYYNLLASINAALRFICNTIINLNINCMKEALIKTKQHFVKSNQQIVLLFTVAF